MAKRDQNGRPIVAPEADMRTGVREPKTNLEVVEWFCWLASSPPEVKAVAERMPPWHLYEAKNVPGQVLRILSYSKPMDGSPLSLTCTPVAGHLAGTGVSVFGVRPEDLMRVPEVPFCALRS